MKKIIINADDFGCSIKTNEAVMLGAKSGVISSASLLASGSGFENAVKEILPQIPALDIGFHFNIIEGKSLTNPSMLTDSAGFFNRSWIEIMLKSSSKKFLSQLKSEFTAQLEKISAYVSVSHIDSHVHTHAVPAIFNLSAELAAEYKIPFIRTQNEIPYKIKDIPLDSAYFGGCLKNAVLNTFTAVNKKNHPDIKTSDSFIGVLYSGRMTQQTIYEGLKKIKNDNSLTEIIFHPSLDNPAANAPCAGGILSRMPFLKAEASDSPRLNRKREFEITQDADFIKEIEKLGFEQTSFSKLAGMLE